MNVRRRRQDPSIKATRVRNCNKCTRDVKHRYCNTSKTGNLHRFRCLTNAFVRMHEMFGEVRGSVQEKVLWNLKYAEAKSSRPFDLCSRIDFPCSNPALLHIPRITELDALVKFWRKTVNCANKSGRRPARREWIRCSPKRRRTPKYCPWLRVKWKRRALKSSCKPAGARPINNDAETRELQSWATLQRVRIPVPNRF